MTSTTPTDGTSQARKTKRASRRRPHVVMRELVLVEDDRTEALDSGGESLDAAMATRGTPARPAGPQLGPGLPRRARRWPLVVPGLALVVAAAAVTTAISDGRERARLAALADVAGILAPLDEPATVLWSRDVARARDLAEVAGRLVGVETRPDGSVDVVALDPSTGAAIWRVAARPPGELNTWARCASPTASTASEADATPVVVCIVADEVVTYENAAGTWPYSTRSRLLVLDAVTGAVVSEAPAAPNAAAARIGSDVVSSSVDDDGRVHVARTDALGAAVRWSFVSPDPLPLARSGIPEVSVSVVDGVIIVNGGSGWILSGDGAVIDTWAVTGRVAVLNAGRVLALPRATDDHHLVTEVSDAAGRSFTAVGNPVVGAVDDGSLTDLVLMQPPAGGDLVAYDLASGRARWSTPSAADARVMVIDGRVIRAERGQLICADGRTGRTVWTRLVDQPARISLFSDGRFALVTELVRDRDTVLSAYGLDDGRLRWQVDIADNLAMFAVGGRLYGSSERTLAAIGSDGT